MQLRVQVVSRDNFAANAVRRICFSLCLSECRQLTFGSPHYSLISNSSSQPVRADKSLLHAKCRHNKQLVQSAQHSFFSLINAVLQRVSTTVRGHPHGVHIKVHKQYADPHSGPRSKGS